LSWGLVWAAGWTPTARYLGDLFLAAQVALAYFTAGVAKAVSATWRSGRAMTAILSAEGYGTRAFGDLLSRLLSTFAIAGLKMLLVRGFGWLVVH
jgi:hypothetical protein